MRAVSALSVVIVALCAVPAGAQTAADPENMKATDVATSPLADVNLKKRDVPPVLEAALADTYTLDGLRNCAGYAAAIRDLDAVLGDDIDVAEAKSSGEKMGNSAGSIAKSLISSFIPFRGIVREVSGANAQQRAWERALYAGSVRRAFLKGVGQTRGCAYPARAATPQVIAALIQQREAARAAKADDQPKPAAQQGFESRPVVQPIPGNQRR